MYLDIDMMYMYRYRYRYRYRSISGYIYIYIHTYGCMFFYLEACVRVIIRDDVFVLELMFV
jgi:hypothetical protein